MTLYLARSPGFVAATRLEFFFGIRDEYSEDKERGSAYSPRYKASGRIQLTLVIWFGGKSFGNCSNSQIDPVKGIIWIAPHRVVQVLQA